MERIERKDDEWRDILSPDVYHILRESGTEPPFSGKYVDFKDKGKYICAGCGTELFDSGTKFDSGSGWPSFWKPVSVDVIDAMEDHSHGRLRTEVRCSRCGSHLGHVFDDGPPPTGLRYCINSLALEFRK
ncbi:MAG TPA: peptide-methionine (R)-S-oxide reductase MsrB [Candidatus Methanofastidiosa archaeon]|nr:peptide-methionine (R)-S-oxide reductase MsrB [Candidatus Methanofastidiosa archaeon]